MNTYFSKRAKETNTGFMRLFGFSVAASPTATRNDYRRYGMSNFRVIGAGLAFGITWALGIFVLGIAAMLTGLGLDLVNVFGSLYVGYSPHLNWQYYWC